jgi:hypothetical protein
LFYAFVTLSSLDLLALFDLEALEIDLFGRSLTEIDLSCFLFPLVGVARGPVFEQDLLAPNFFIRFVGVTFFIRDETGSRPGLELNFDLSLDLETLLLFERYRLGFLKKVLIVEI